MRPSTVTLASLLERAYAHHADRMALVDGERRLTYAELGDRARRVAGGLAGLGLVPGDRVVLLSGNRGELLEAEQGLWLGGLVRVALSHRLHPREVAYIAADCGARAALCDPSWAPPLDDLRRELPDLEHVIAFGGPFEDLVAAGGPGEGRRPAAGDVAALLYTSGTTGRPKGATLTHAAWVAMVRNSMVELPPVSEDDVVLHVAPLSHLSGYAATTYVARGAGHVVLRAFEPAATLAAIGDHGVTTLPMVPTMLNLLLLEAEGPGRQVDTSALRTVLYAGSAIAPDRLARAVRRFGPVFVQFYGLSETPMPLTALSQADHARGGDRLASAGRVSPFVELRVVGDDGRDVPVGQPGEVVVRGDTVMTGYWGQPELTAEMIDGDGWAATGDVGRLDGDGYLYLVDRKKDMIVTGGYNVYPSEVEHVISQLPAVQEVAVVGAPDERFGEAVAALVVVRPGYHLGPDEVVAACGGALAGYKKPRIVELVDELPKTGSGKVLRRQLRERFWAGADRHVGG